MKLNRLRWFVAVAIAPVCACTEQPEPDYPQAEEPPAPPEKQQAARMPEKNIANDADALVRRMSDYLGGLKEFSFSAEHTIEAVLPSGEKRQFLAASHVSVERPNKLRVERRGELADLAFYYDGDTVTLYGKRMNVYAQTEAPDTLDEMIDFARAKLDLEAPAADLLYGKTYDILMEDAVSGEVVGTTMIRNVAVKHVAVRGNVVDYQLWIQDGDKPLPMRYVITTKDLKGQPQYTVELHDWKTAEAFPAKHFEFTPPAGAQKIEFMGMMEQKPAQP